MTVKCLCSWHAYFWDQFCSRFHLVISRLYGCEVTIFCGYDVKWLRYFVVMMLCGYDVMLLQYYMVLMLCGYHNIWLYIIILCDHDLCGYKVIWSKRLYGYVLIKWERKIPESVKDTK